jgi:hypothetical protein
VHSWGLKQTKRFPKKTKKNKALPPEPSIKQAFSKKNKIKQVFKEMGQAHDNTNIIIIAGYLISLKTLLFLFVLGKRLLYSRFW